MVGTPKAKTEKKGKAAQGKAAQGKTAQGKAAQGKSAKTPTAQNQPGHHNAHSRTRADHMQETAEDYVEAILALTEEHGACRIVKLAERFGVTHVTAIKILRRLVAEELVITEPYKPVQLTKTGRSLALKCRKRHQLVEAFLQKLGVSAAVAAVDAEGIEHHLSPETLRRMQAFVETD
jgi:DtxR family manganese transport transcriptional regulator